MVFEDMTTIEGEKMMVRLRRGRRRRANGKKKTENTSESSTEIEECSELEKRKGESSF